MNDAGEHWGSRTAFLIATIGSAAGIGNIWRFAYVAGEDGGGRFLLLYLACIVLIGLPLLLAELTLGRADVAGRGHALLSSRTWLVFRWVSVCAACLVLSYYAVIAGWTLHYLFDAIGSPPTAASAQTPEQTFHLFISSPMAPLLWQGIMLVITVMVVAMGIRGGIEIANRYLMPALFVIVAGLAAYGLTLEGASAGLTFLFAPDWSALQRPQVYLAALGQAFFSLGLGVAIFYTYGSYLPAQHRLPGLAGAIVVGDTLVALLAGIAIFTAVFAFGLSPAAGPELAFITLPRIFANMYAGQWVAIAFFALLAIGALTSMISILEVPVAFGLRHTSWSRRRLSAVIGVAVFVAGIPSALGFGLLAEWTWQGRGILDAVDYVASNLLLPCGGLLIAMLVAWAWRGDDARALAGIEHVTMARCWLWLVRWLAPVLTLLILVQGLVAV